MPARRRNGNEGELPGGGSGPDGQSAYYTIQYTVDPPPEVILGQALNMCGRGRSGGGDITLLASLQSTSNVDNTIPEPATFVLTAAGAAALALARRNTLRCRKTAR